MVPTDCQKANVVPIVKKEIGHNDVLRYWMTAGFTTLSYSTTCNCCLTIITSRHQGPEKAFNMTLKLAIHWSKFESPCWPDQLSICVWVPPLKRSQLCNWLPLKGHVGIYLLSSSSNQYNSWQGLARKIFPSTWFAWIEELVIHPPHLAC